MDLKGIRLPRDEKGYSGIAQADNLAGGIPLGLQPSPCFVPRAPGETLLFVGRCAPRAAYAAYFREIYDVPYVPTVPWEGDYCQQDMGLAL